MNPKYLHRKSVWNTNILPSGWRLRLSTVGYEEHLHSGNPTRVWNPPDWDLTWTCLATNAGNLASQNQEVGLYGVTTALTPEEDTRQALTHCRRQKWYGFTHVPVCVQSREGLRHTRKGGRLTGRAICRLMTPSVSGETDDALGAQRNPRHPRSR